MLIIERFLYQLNRPDKVISPVWHPPLMDPDTWHELTLQDAELKQMLDSGVKPRFWNDGKLSSLPDTRERYHAVFLGDADKARQEAGDSVYEKEISIPARDGTNISALVYGPKDAPAGGSPLAIFIHGGGFILGIAEMETPPCIAVAKAYGCICVSLYYRLSPEVKFPTAYEDCWDAIIWVCALDASHRSIHAAVPTDMQISAVKERVVSGGGSHKGVYPGRNFGWRTHLDTTLPPRTGQRPVPPLTGVYLGVTPSLPPQALIPKYAPFYRSREALKDGMTLTSKSTALYDVAVEPDFASPLWSPLLWPTGHANLPPTFFQICGADLLRDEALIYERELRLEHGTKTRVIVYPGLPHIFWYNYPSHSAAKKYVDDTCFALGWLLGRET